MSGYLDAHSAGILRVRADTDAKRLAKAIIKTAERDSRLQVRAAGVDAVNTAVKAIIIADGEAYSRGHIFFRRDSFDVVNGTNGSGPVTVIVMSLRLVPIEAVAHLWSDDLHE